MVPVMNARYALNAANARWGSLYDALYGTDVISEEDGAVRAGAYNPVRGHKVIEWARDFLDSHFPLNQGTHKNAAHYAVVDGGLIINQIDGASPNTQIMTAFDTDPDVSQMAPRYTRIGVTSSGSDSTTPIYSK